MYKPFWALLFLLSCTYSAAFADDPTSESKGWGGVAPAPSENECRSFIEAALKEQRQVEAGGGGDGVEEASTIAPEDQINAVDQVNEETTADASTENIESTEPSDAVEETNERVEISETEPEEPETSIEHEQAATDSADEIPGESVESEGAPVESTEELVTESAEAEATPEVVSEAEPEETVTESAEAEGVPVESSEAEETAEAVEAEGAQTESAEAEPEEVPTEAGEAVAESSDAEATPTESAEAEVPELIVETPSGTGENDVTEEQLKKELAESVEGEIEQPTEEAINTEEIVKDGGESAVEDVLPESRETETEPEEPMSDEEHMLSDQPVETDASGEAPAEQETEISQEVGSEQVEEQSSVETEETATEQPEVQEVEPEEIVEDVVQETVEHVNSPVYEETIASEAKPTEEQITEPINEEVEPSEEERTTQDIEDTENVHSPSEDTGEASETPESPEAIHEEPPVRDTEEATPTTPEESPATNAVVQEIPAESGASVEQESAPQPQTEQEPQDKAVAVDEGVEEEIPEQEDLTLNIEIPENLRSRNHISEVLRLDTGSIDTEAKLLKAEESTLKELKRVYEAAIKPLEILYKYRDLSNRHFGDPEIFSKPLILFMGPWSGGKSTIINYLLDNEYKQTALRTGAEPSPAYFNIVMWGEREEVMDGTQLAADWTFSGLQKFGQGLLDRLRGLKLNNPLLEKVNIVEIPGILEIRKQVERLFPLNDACQWFIDRADIIFLVYDPSKLDVGPETEAILDQLKGREYQTKIILNKADQVKPEELMRVQGTLIWNISPLMSSTEPPVMYSTSLWSHPYQLGSPSRLLFAQEKAFLKDLREAMEKRVENKISSARRFAVRVRNHAKMVDCYLTTYYNHKTFFGNKEKVSEDIIEHPQNYHIYEGLSTLTNISRYDLPDPDVYKDFFRLNPVYDFQQLASTCTYFKGCPINRLDVAIAYDLPELVGRYKKVAEDVKSQGKK